MDKFEKSKNENFKNLAKGLTVLEDRYIREVAKQYYQFCTNHYIKVFFDWRDSITKLQEEEMEDLADGYSYPFL